MQPDGSRRRTLTTVLVVASGLAVLAVIAVPLLIVTAFEAPATPSNGVKDGVGEQARTIAYALRDEEVRSALDEGAASTAIAGRTGTLTPTPKHLREIGTDATGSGSPVLLRAQRMGSSGAAVELAWGGVTGQGSEFGPPARPWVTCLRVQLPVTAVDATEWSVTDVDCPAFAPAVRKDAARIHAADLTIRPLLRPPCFGTTGYCPGG